MYIKRFIIIVIFMMVALQSKNAWAFYMPESISMSQMVTDAKEIVVARITNYVPDPMYQETPRGKGASGIEALVTLARIKARGNYTFDILRQIKGQTERTLRLSMPYVLSSYYDNAKFQINTGSLVLLFLKKDATGQLSPVDDTVPFIPLPQEMQDSAVDQPDASVSSHVIALMLASLEDSAIRHANLFLLRDSVDDRIQKAVSPYLNDPNLRIQDIALYCMLTNQQVQVIPHVARLERKLFPEEETIGSSAKSLEALENLKTSAAIPYLNQLLFEPAKYSRINAIFTLQKLANRSSIPYLILALRDPRSTVAFIAYRKLNQLIDGLGAVRDSDYFEIQRESASRPLYAWWKDELRGKHLKPLTTKDQPQMSQKEISALPIDNLNPLLFDTVTVTRKKAIATLKERADKSSIPYLILALIDPDTTVSYDAYVTLHRLIPTLGTSKSSKEFEANTETATLPIYIWWEDELSGNHLPIFKR